MEMETADFLEGYLKVSEGEVNSRTDFRDDAKNWERLRSASCDLPHLADQALVGGYKCEHLVQWVWSRPTLSLLLRRPLERGSIKL
ncbi:hypothetical protein J6590_100578 [Homalodisca vitripennis]|nr:hypothetical protein J6590_100578 [Homalodisca vitripennis]